MQRKKALELGRNRTTVYYMFSGQYVHVLSAETGAQCTTFSLGKKGHSVLHVLRAETGAQCTTCSQGRNRGTVYYMLSGQKQGHSVLYVLWAETGAQCTTCSLGSNAVCLHMILLVQETEQFQQGLSVSNTLAGSTTSMHLMLHSHFK